jgi:hypothetical protein
MPQTILGKFNKHHKALHFTKKGKKHFDLIFTNKQQNIYVYMYMTDIIIHKNSCHPREHKIATL